MRSATSVTPEAPAAWAVLPVKAFDAAKSRLAAEVSADARRCLAQQLMLTCLDALIASRALAGVIVVSSDARALALARERGAEALTEPGFGLNPALEAARGALAARASALLVVAADLPFVTAEDIRLLLDGAAGASVAIVPDRRRSGTNALLLQPPDAISFAFGEGSFERHFALAAAAGREARVVDLPNLAFDLDAPADLAELREAGWPRLTVTGLQSLR